MGIVWLCFVQGARVVCAGEGSEGTGRIGIEKGTVRRWRALQHGRQRGKRGVRRQGIRRARQKYKTAGRGAAGSAARCPARRASVVCGVCEGARGPESCWGLTWVVRCGAE